VVGLPLAEMTAPAVQNVPIVQAVRSEYRSTGI
jgi:hypothetical protein